MLKFPVMKLFSSNFTMEMINILMLSTKNSLNQRMRKF